MTIFIIAAVILTIAITGGGLYLAFTKLNEHGEACYGYKPLSGWTIAPVAIGYGLVLIAGSALAKDPANMWVALGVLAAVVIAVCARIKVKSSLGVAALAAPLLNIAAVLSVATIVIYIGLAILSTEGRSRNDRWY
jgi:hypothetical protein